ncbi:MAG: hypothetical protein U0R50_04740 [Gaiellales bacterium]
MTATHVRERRNGGRKLKGDELLEQLRPLGMPAEGFAEHVHDDLELHGGSASYGRLAQLLSGPGDLVISGLAPFFKRRVSSPWAIVVVTFKDDPKPSSSLAKYEAVFTSTGEGTLNMVDYFWEMSHGMLDLSGTKVFGPYVLDRPRADYVGNVYPQPAGKLNRNGILDLAKATATTAGVDLTQFAGVVVCGTPQLDLCGWVGGGAALCDDLSLQPSLLGQEMGHGYGLDHSRRDGSLDDYQDAWDTMSTANAFMAWHPTYGSIGPGLNAVNMHLRGWLDERRVHTIPLDRSTAQTFTLRPLHDRSHAGALVLAIGDVFVEFRHRSRWDAGIPRSCVLVHYPDGNTSYIMRGKSGSYDLVAGDRFERGSETTVWGDHLVIAVDSIDDAAKTATVSVTYRPFRKPDIPIKVGDVFGGVASDGPGWIVVGGKVVPVPPRGPARVLVESVVAALEQDQAGLAAGRYEQRIDALGGVVRAVGQLAGSIELVSETPPGLERLR